MTFRGDDRAVTVQIGAVLLFGLLVVAMSAYQVTVVPAETETAEFEHSQAVQTDVLDLRSAAHRAAVAGGSHPTTVDLGVTYPRRTFFVNPPPARGHAETVAVGDGTLTVSNATAGAREVADYWNGTPRSFDTRTVRYRPSYNQYADAPRTAYGNTVVYNRFANGYVGNLSGQTLVDGRRLSPVLVGGGLSKGGTDARSITPRAVSAASRTVPVRGDGDNVTLTLPTRLSAEAWRSLLADELDGTGDETDDRYVHAVRNVSATAVEIEMEANATYDLRIAKVGFGSVSEPEPYYVVPVSANASVAEGSRAAVTFEVRDRYDNPVSGASVDLSLDGPGTLGAADRRGSSVSGLLTDEEGRVTVTYAPGDVDRTTDVTVRAAISSPASDAPARATEAAVGVAAGSEGAGSDAAYDTTWDLTAIGSRTGVSCDAEVDTCTFDRSAGGSLHLFADTSPTAADAPVDFALNDTAAAAIGHADDRTDGDGDASMDVHVAETGTFLAYVASGGSGDALTIRAVDGGGATGRLSRDNPTRTFDANGDGRAGGFEFTLRNGYDGEVRVTSVRVDPDDSAVDGLRDASRDSGDRASELHVGAIGGGTSGTVDVPTRSGGGREEFLSVPADGVTLSTTRDQTVTLYDAARNRETTAETAQDGTPTIPAGKKAQFTFTEFYALSDRYDGGYAAVEASDHTFTVTVTYEVDGSEETETFVVDP